MSENLQLLVLVRHGKSEGDERREAWARGEDVPAPDKPELEDIVKAGIEESQRAGRIAKNVLKTFGIERFDGYFVSETTRSLQSAVAMDLPEATWQSNPNLNERDRGRLRGLPPSKQRELYPGFFNQTRQNRLRATPPGGQSLVEVIGQFSLFLDEISHLKSIIAITHRDTMWAAMQPLEGLSDEEMCAVNTDNIPNGGVRIYAALNPVTGQQFSDLAWKCSIDPIRPAASVGWQVLPHIAKAHGLSPSEPAVSPR